jgi:hypothetical protein
LSYDPIVGAGILGQDSYILSHSKRILEDPAS